MSVEVCGRGLKDLDARILATESLLDSIPDRIAELTKKRNLAKAGGDDARTKKLTMEIRQLQDEIDALEGALEELEAQRPKAERTDSATRLLEVDKKLTTLVGDIPDLYSRCIDLHAQYLAALSEARTAEGLARALHSERRYHQLLTGDESTGPPVPAFPVGDITISATRERSLLQDGKHRPEKSEWDRLRSRREVQANKLKQRAQAVPNNWQEFRM